ncbi:MAG: ribulose-phosphate 3-epimerase [Candidatus Omnitrophota bacterium]
MKIKVSPSLLSADFSCLAQDIKRVEDAGADMLHIDVMDGHFVPNITIGPVVVKYIKKVSHVPLDVHLMIRSPEKFVDAFVDAGSDMITMHIEAISSSKFKIQSLKLRKQGVKIGVSLNPNTPLSKIKNILKYADLVLIMSVYPGFAGQKFIPEVLPKINNLRSIYSGDIAIDGGINEETAKTAIQAGANIIAVGSYIFGAKNIKQLTERIKNVRDK